MYIYIYIYMYIYIYIYIYTFTYAHIHIYTYIYIHNRTFSRRRCWTCCKSTRRASRRARPARYSQTLHPAPSPLTPHP